MSVFIECQCPTDLVDGVVDAAAWKQPEGQGHGRWQLDPVRKLPWSPAMLRDLRANLATTENEIPEGREGGRGWGEAGR